MMVKNWYVLFTCFWFRFLSQVKFLFKSAEEAESAKEELKVFRETLSTEPMDFEFKEYEGICSLLLLQLQHHRRVLEIISLWVQCAVLLNCPCKSALVTCSRFMHEVQHMYNCTSWLYFMYVANTFYSNTSTDFKIINFKEVLKVILKGIYCSQNVVIP